MLAQIPIPSGSSLPWFPEEKMIAHAVIILLYKTGTHTLSLL